jgi:parvulin-like peptidyl-prolyl isomerase
MILGKIVGRFKTTVWIILILLALALLVPTTIPSFHRMIQPDFGVIAGKKVVFEDFVAAQQAVELGIRLNNKGEIPRAPQLNEQIAQMAWLRLLMLSEADALNIHVSELDVQEHLTSMPAFQKDNKYDPQAYRRFVAEFLGSVGVSESKFLQSVKDDLRIQALRNAITAGVNLSPQEINEEFQRVYSPVHLEIVEIKNADFLSGITIKDEEIQKEYNDNSENPQYRTPALRKIHVVKWSLTADHEKLPDTERNKAMQALRNQAADFALALVTPVSENAPAPTIQELAKEKGLTLITTDFFSEEEGPKNIPSNFSLVRTAFRLTAENPTSDVIPVNNDFVVIALAEEKPSTLRPLNEVRNKIIATLKERAAQQKAQEYAQSTYSKLKDALEKENKPWPEALKSLNLKAESIKPFSPIDESEILAHPIGQALQSLAYRLKANQISPPISTAKGQIIGYLKRRDPADPERLEEFTKEYADMMLEQKKQQIMQDWVTLKTKDRKYKVPAFLDQQKPDPTRLSPPASSESAVPPLSPSQ